MLSVGSVLQVAFSAFTMLTGREEGYLVCKTPLCHWSHPQRFSVEVEKEKPRENWPTQVHWENGCWKGGKNVITKRTRKSQHLQKCQNLRHHFFVPCDLDLWLFDPKINGFSGFTVKHFHVTFGYPSCIGFWDIVWKNRQTYIVKTLTLQLLSVQVTNKL